MNKLICIQLSIILVFSPLAAQDKKYAKIFTLNGIVSEGTIVYFDVDRVDFLQKGSILKFAEYSFPLQFIYILQDSDSRILIHNLENRKDFFDGYKGDKTDLNQFVYADTQLNESLISYTPMSSINNWFIVLKSGENYRDVVIRALENDKLNIRILSKSKQLHLSDIVGIFTGSEIKTKNRFIQGAKWGGFAGLGLGLVGIISLATGDCKSGCLGFGAFIIALLTVLPAFGAIAGGTINYLGGITNQKSYKYSLSEKAIIEKNRIIFNLLVAQDRGKLDN